jgi:hypothetical protein
MHIACIVLSYQENVHICGWSGLEFYHLLKMYPCMLIFVVVEGPLHLPVMNAYFIGSGLEHWLGFGVVVCPSFDSHLFFLVMFALTYIFHSTLQLTM